MVNVISPKSENIVAKQAEALRAVQSSKIPTWNNEFRITSGNIELRFEKQINELRSEQAQERQRVGKLKEIESRVPKPIEPLKTFNTLSQNELAIKLKRAKLPIKRWKKLPKK